LGSEKVQSRGLDQSIQEERLTLRSKFHRLIKLIWIKELTHQWKESNLVPIHKKSDKTDCSIYRGI
jgi:hypothetical protein